VERSVPASGTCSVQYRVASRGGGQQQIAVKALASGWKLNWVKISR
jgi:hypothetical protein